MPLPQQFTEQEVTALLDSPTIITYVTGGVQVEKAGIRGFGQTISEAAADWGRKFAKGICLPKDISNP
jgi:hypothetical protein